MDDNNKPDFMAALNEEFGLTPEDTTPTPPAPTPVADDAKDQPEQPPKADTEEDKPVQPAAADDKPDDAKPAAPQGGEEKVEEPKFATKQDVMDAIRETGQETAQRVTKVNSARDEIIDKLYPEGIDKNVYDSNGKVIKTAQDIVDRGLINERTGEPYTYEEAASFMLEAGRKTAENLEELNSWAENVAEQNITLIESNHRVMDKWGDTLKSLPKEDVEKLAAQYISTLEFDKTNSYVTKVVISPEQFYDIALAPYAQLNEALAKNAEYEAEAKRLRDEAEQAERSGLPPQRGTSATKSNTGDPMVDALIDEMNKE